MQLNILLIEDNHYVRDVIEKYLEKKNYIVKSYENAHDCLENIKVSKHFFPDVCIVDYTLNGDMNGDELIFNLHEQGFDSFIIYTGDHWFEIPDKLKQIGISENNVLFKPTNFSVLEQKLHELSCTKSFN